jgi:AraC family transcriptional regulator of adaptative response/methylated-DNA-[protein]-cysteine methyltransferase
MSRHHFHRVFKAFTGITPGQYSRSVKERAAVNGLARGETVTEAIYGAGYGSSSRFYEMLAPHLGMKPAAFAKGGAGERILFAVGQCFLGSILVAATGKGICAIEFGDDPETLIDDFQDRFAQAELIGGDPDFERLVAEVVGCVEQPFREFALPLHVRGTVFQHKVWRALREIPVGTTLSYAELAAKIGQPSAVRAVASACAKNKLAVAIPCHRVVRSSGALSGYRWKVDRKAALLAREAAS